MPLGRPALTHSASSRTPVRSGAWRRLVLGGAATLALTGCSADESPSAAPSVIGDRTQLCTDRVEAAQATSVIGQPVAELRELNTFVAGERAGECALLGTDGGALLSVQVVHDVGAKALEAELKTISQDENYSGDDHSGVTGEGITTTALVAVDDNYYVRVLGLGGSSVDQRTAALALATSVAASSKAIQ